MQAIRSVGSILAPYDSDQLIPVFGFGARLPPNGEVSHCFPLNFNPQGPDVFGVEVGLYGVINLKHAAAPWVIVVGQCVCVCLYSESAHVCAMALLNTTSY